MSITTRRLTADLVTLLVLSAGAALAHDTWLLPARFAAAPVLWVESRPTSLTVKPDQVMEYLDEVGAPETSEPAGRPRKAGGSRTGRR